MTPERWRKITELFHVVRAHDAVRREAVLTEVCATDPALRNEVESLIAADHEAGPFGDTPMCLNAPLLESGTSFGPYRINHLLGSGGMGDVYTVHDTRLDRTVAIKVLARQRQRGYEIDPEAYMQVSVLPCRRCSLAIWTSPTNGWQRRRNNFPMSPGS
jgi:hypothetical protein